MFLKKISTDILLLGEGLSLSKFSRRLDYSTHGVMINVNVLEQAGLIEFEKKGNKKLIRVTEKGKRIKGYLEEIKRYII